MVKAKASPKNRSINTKLDVEEDVQQGNTKDLNLDEEEPVNLYNELGFTGSFSSNKHISLNELKKAYRKLALKHHVRNILLQQESPSWWLHHLTFDGSLINSLSIPSVG
jgi:hypothetical protein